jgi:hypothetical protein
VYDADLIIVLKEGHVAEQGTHRQLIDRGGIYSELWSSESFLFCGKAMLTNFHSPGSDRCRNEGRMK